MFAEYKLTAVADEMPEQMRELITYYLPDQKSMYVAIMRCEKFYDCVDGDGLIPGTHFTHWAYTDAVEFKEIGGVTPGDGL